MRTGSRQSELHGKRTRCLRFPVIGRDVTTETSYWVLITIVIQLRTCLGVTKWIYNHQECRNSWSARILWRKSLTAFGVRKPGRMELPVLKSPMMQGPLRPRESYNFSPLFESKVQIPCGPVLLRPLGPSVPLLSRNFEGSYNVYVVLHQSP